MNVPFIPNAACGSHWNVYVPATSVTFHVTDVVSATVVIWLTPPGPNRWKLWKDELSVIWNVYSPGGSVCPSTDCAPFVNVITAAGPTVPVSVVAVPRPFPGMTIASAPSATTPAVTKSLRTASSCPTARPARRFARP